MDGGKFRRSAPWVAPTLDALLTLMCCPRAAGWLNIKLSGEFVQFSVLGHVVYGGVLGGLCRRALLRPVVVSSPRLATTAP